MEETLLKRNPEEAKSKEDSTLEAIKKDITYIRRKLGVWLTQNSPECFSKQRHLIDDSPEQAYWHYGEYVMLGDLLALIQTQDHQNSDSQPHVSIQDI